MSAITNDEELFRHASRARGRVVLITGQIHICNPRISVHSPFSYSYAYIGGAAGPARHAAWSFAKNGFVPLHLQVLFVRH